MTTYQIVGISLALVVIIAYSILLGIVLCYQYFPRTVTVQESINHSVIRASEFPGDNLPEKINNAMKVIDMMPKGAELRIPDGVYSFDKPMIL